MEVRSNPDVQATYRDVARYDCRDVEGRVASGTAAEDNAGARLQGSRR